MGVVMTDQEYMREAFCGNDDAMALVQAIATISHTWDDLIDQDKPVSPERVHQAFMLSLLEIPKNPFYQKHCLDLLPVMTTGILNWQIANRYEQGTDRESHILAHVLRYSIADIATFIAYLVGGAEHAATVGPELRRRSQKDTIDNYLNEIGARHEHI